MNSIPVTSFITIVAGVAVFVASQYILRLILEPLVELKKTIIGISSALSYDQARHNQRQSKAIDEIGKLLNIETTYMDFQTK